MSQAVNTYQVLDDRLAIHDGIQYGVEVGGQSINQQRFSSQTKTASSVSVNCLIPSLQTIIDRHVLLRTTFNIQISGVVAANGAFLLNYPTNVALSPFMFSQMVNNLSCQVNNTTLNSNYQDTLTTMLRQMKPEELAKYGDYTCTQLDYYQSPATAGSLSAFRSILTAPDYDVKPRGSWVINSIVGNTATNAINQAKSVTLNITTTEPIFVSPFLFGDVLDEHNSGLSGVSSINFNFNIGNVGRVLTWTPLGAGDTLTGVVLGGVDANNNPVPAFNSFEILMTFISPKPSQLIPLTCALPYYQLNAYKTSTTSADASAPFNFTSSIVSPNCIPDKVYLLVRPAITDVVGAASINDFRYPITNVNITWNTQSGLLATATQQELYYMSKRAGLKMDWMSFNGKAGGSGTAALGATPTLLSGGIVCLDFNQHIPIMEQYYSSGSLGQWTFQATITCDGIAGRAAEQVELVVIFFQSGIFQSTSGSSSQYVGVLSKDEVLRVAQEESMVKTEHYRVVGGGIGSWLSSAIKSSSPAIKSFIKDKAKDLLPAAAAALNKRLGLDGSAISAGAMSAGAESGGRRPRVKH